MPKIEYRTVTTNEKKEEKLVKFQVINKNDLPSQ